MGGTGDMGEVTGTGEGTMGGMEGCQGGMMTTDICQDLN